MANIQLGGSVSTTGTSILGNFAVSFATDADHTLSVTEYTNNFLALTSVPALTAIRNLVAPLVIGQSFVIQNNTTGGHSIFVWGGSGSGVTIPNGGIASVVCDGTNYTTTGITTGGAAGGDLSGTYPNPTVINIHGNPVAAQTLSSTQDGYVLTWDNTDGYYQAIAPVSTMYGGSHNGGSGVVLWKNAISKPTSAPTGGSIVYENSGTLTQYGSGGISYDVAPAGSGTINSQAAVINRKVAFLRTSNTNPNTILTYTIPFSVTFGAFVWVETTWTARDTSGTATMVAAAGKGVAAFNCTSAGTVAQVVSQVAGNEKVFSSFNSTTGGFISNFDIITWNNLTAGGGGQQFVTSATTSAISYTTAASGVINIQVTSPTSSNIDWTADVYVQVA